MFISVSLFMNFFILDQKYLVLSCVSELSSLF